MRIENLPNPGTYSNSHQLRVKIAHAISMAEVAANSSVAGTTTLADGLHELFMAAASAVVDLRRTPYVPPVEE